MDFHGPKSRPLSQIVTALCPWTLRLAWEDKHMMPSGKYAAASVDGVVARGEVAVEGNCGGKTLEELCAAGQTRPFKE